MDGLGTSFDFINDLSREHQLTRLARKLQVYIDAIAPDNGTELENQFLSHMLGIDVSGRVVSLDLVALFQDHLKFGRPRRENTLKLVTFYRFHLNHTQRYSKYPPICKPHRGYTYHHRAAEHGRIGVMKRLVGVHPLGGFHQRGGAHLRRGRTATFLRRRTHGIRARATKKQVNQVKL